MVSCWLLTVGVVAVFVLLLFFLLPLWDDHYAEGEMPPWNLDERNPYRYARGFRPLRRVMVHQVLHNCVFGHVLHKICLRSVCPTTHATAIGLGVLDSVG